MQVLQGSIERGGEGRRGKESKEMSARGIEREAEGSGPGGA
jgi:hypothetical protein